MNNVWIYNVFNFTLHTLVSTMCNFIIWFLILARRNIFLRSLELRLNPDRKLNLQISHASTTSFQNKTFRERKHLSPTWLEPYLPYKYSHKKKKKGITSFFKKNTQRNTNTSTSSLDGIELETTAGCFGVIGQRGGGEATENSFTHVDAIGQWSD